MFFSEEDKAVIKNDYEEKGWSAYRIWKEHPSKGWVESSVRSRRDKTSDETVRTSFACN